MYFKFFWKKFFFDLRLVFICVIIIYIKIYENSIEFFVVGFRLEWNFKNDVKLLFMIIFSVVLKDLCFINIFVRIFVRNFFIMELLVRFEVEKKGY